MSGTENAHLWTDSALMNEELWKTIRIMAMDAMECFGWSG
jgi:hypothetical protein